VSEVDELWLTVCLGDVQGFASWMGRVERPIRRALEPFARAVDAEGVVQETLSRMWLFAREKGAGLVGENASLRFAIGMARNIARNEARKHGRERLLPPEDLPDPPAAPDPPADPFLRLLIRRCFERLASRPRAALEARIGPGHGLSDRDLAARLRMSLNTFLQNVVRARRQLAACLEKSGVRLEEVLR